MVVPGTHLETLQLEKLYPILVAPASPDAPPARTTKGNQEELEEILPAIREQGSHADDTCQQGTPRETRKTPRTIHGVPTETHCRMGRTKTQTFTITQQ